MKKFWMILAVLMSMTATAWASEGTTGDYLADIGTKFVRGLGNVVSSPAEIPCRAIKNVKDEGGQGFFMGMAKGIGYFVYRAFVGVDEVATFVIPMEPTLEPVCQSK